jgi:transcriptional regulator with XRE-family HTH domain
MTIERRAKRALRGGFVRSKPFVKLTSGKMVRILREKNELTQSELARLANLTQATISSLESDRISLGVERARALARVLHVHPAVLLFPDWSEEDLAV